MINNLSVKNEKLPFLSKDISMGNCSNLPDFSKGPKGDERAVLEAIKNAGYEGVQGADPQICNQLGLRYSAIGRVNKVGDEEDNFKMWKEQGYECATLHVGWGMESDAEVYALIEYVLANSVITGLPIYIETHRATITQDIWRTVKMVEKFPEVRFNGDFSHWYTGLEMKYGGFENKLRFIQPVLDRVNFIHARIGTAGCIQVGIKNDGTEPYVEHFKEMWKKSFIGFLKRAKNGEYLSFTPELLKPEQSYARVFPNAEGQLVEESDRWEQAKLYTKIALEVWEQAKKEIAIKQ